MKYKTFKFLLPLVIGSLIISCYPDGPEYTSDYDLVGSVYDPEFNFNNNSTFILPDSLVFVQDENDDKEYLTESQETEILNHIRNAFTDMGWIDSTFTNDTTPDVVITVMGIATKTQGAWWSYWGWYGWGGYYPGWGYPGYPWYPPWYPGGGYPVYYEYTTGSLILEMIEWGDNPDLASETPPIVWMAGLNGLVNRVPVNTSNILDGIDKIFELSPYLDKNPSQ